MDNDFLEEIDIQPSSMIERFILNQGAQLYDALVEADRYDETALLTEVIGAYAYVVSNYGDKTGRLPESLAVDLNEAALLKFNGSEEWQRFADQFKNSIAGLNS